MAAAAAGAGAGAADGANHAKLCPFCGRTLPAWDFDDHVTAELAAGTEGDWEDVRPPPAE